MMEVQRIHCHNHSVNAVAGLEMFLKQEYLIWGDRRTYFQNPKTCTTNIQHRSCERFQIVFLPTNKTKIHQVYWDMCIK